MPAFADHRSSVSALAASAAIGPGAIVTWASGVDRSVVAVATQGFKPLGVTLATAVNQGDGVTVFDEGNTVRAIANASLGRGAEIGANNASTSLGPVAGIAGSVIWSVGQAVSAAAAGEAFGLYINPSKLSG